MTKHSRHIEGISLKSHAGSRDSFPPGQKPRKTSPNKINNYDGFACDIVKPGMIFRELDPWRHLKSDTQERWHQNNGSFWNFRAVNLHLGIFITEAAAGHRQCCHSAGSTAPNPPGRAKWAAHATTRLQGTQISIRCPHHSPEQVFFSFKFLNTFISPPALKAKRPPRIRSHVYQHRELTGSLCYLNIFPFR